MAAALVIFDCDGVLVDSEAIAIEVMRTALARLGLPLDAAAVHRRFLGRSLASTVADLAAGGIVFDERAQREMARELRVRFDAELAPVPGIAGVIDRLAVPCCVASSSDMGRLRRSLRTAGLLERFGEAVFSADEVARGKPAPDLFLHAAARMGVAPADCVVIEDSVPGLLAAAAAGMGAVAFAGGSHLADEEGRAALAAHAGALVTRADDLARHLPMGPAVAAGGGAT